MADVNDMSSELLKELELGNKGVVLTMEKRIKQLVMFFNVSLGTDRIKVLHGNNVRMSESFDR